jgi:hypothetical protein
MRVLFYLANTRKSTHGFRGSGDWKSGRVHIDERVLTDGKIDLRKSQPIARCGYFEYAIVEETFEMVIPGDKWTLMGLEGSAKHNSERREEVERTGIDGFGSL